jgi:hypothetical protein
VHTGNPMLKRFTLVLFLLAALLAGIYALRVQIVTRLANTALEKSDLQIIQLEQLEVGWRGLNIERLVLGIGPTRTPQTLEQLELTYALLEARPEHVAVERASLQVPSSDSEAPRAPLLLSELLRQLSATPLDSLEVGHLFIGGADLPLVELPLALSASMQAESLSLTLEDAAQRKLDLSFRPDGQARNGVDLTIATPLGEALSLALDFDAAGGRLDISGSGRVDTAALADLAAPLAPLPDTVLAVAGTLPFRLTGRVNDDLNATLQFDVEMTLAAGAGLQLEIAIPEEATQPASLELSLRETAALTARRVQGGDLQLSADAAATDFVTSSALAEMAGSVAELKCSEIVEPQCRGRLQLSGKAPALTGQGEQPITVNGLELAANGAFKISGNNLDLQLDPGQLLSLDRLQQEDMVLRQAAVVADSDLELHYDLSAGAIALSARELVVQIPRARLADLYAATRLSLSQLRVSVDDGGAVKAGTHIITEGINLQRADTWLPALGLEADISLVGQQITTAGRVGSDGAHALFSFAALHNLDAGSGSARVTAEAIAFDATDRRLSRYFSNWPFDLELYAGELTLEGDFDWQSAQGATTLEGLVNTRLENLAGVYGDIGFLGLSGEIPLRLESPARVISTGDALLSVEQVDVGVPVEQATARFRLDTGRRIVELDSLEARMFGGRVWTESAVYQLDRPANRIDVGVDGLQLDRLLARTGYDAVEGSGSISGLLPLDIGTAGITMHRGMLAAKAPGGVFRYKADIATGTNPAMAQALAALSNYHYSVFQTEADYLDTGDLELRMTLRGQNPDMYQSRPIHLNLNVSDNVPMLLKSLQAGREIAEKVSRKVGGMP